MRPFGQKTIKLTHNEFCDIAMDCEELDRVDHATMIASRQYHPDYGNIILVAALADGGVMICDDGVEFEGELSQND